MTSNSPKCHSPIATTKSLTNNALMWGSWSSKALGTYTPKLLRNGAKAPCHSIFEKKSNRFFGLTIKTSLIAALSFKLLPAKGVALPLLPQIPMTTTSLPLLILSPDSVSYKLQTMTPSRQCPTRQPFLVSKYNLSNFSYNRSLQPRHFLPNNLPHPL